MCKEVSFYTQGAVNLVKAFILIQCNPGLWIRVFNQGTSSHGLRQDDVQ